MRSRLLAVSMLLLLPAFVWGQFTPLSSLLRDVSYGLFQNEIDAALSVDETGYGPGFTGLENDFLFGGLGNLSSAQRREAFGATDYTAFDPLWIGYYRAGERPWSLFQSVFADDGEQGSTTVTRNGMNVETVTVGTTNTDHIWYDNIVTLDERSILTTRVETQTQFLTTFAGMNIGAFVAVGLADDSAPADNFTRTTVHQFNTAGAGDVPSVQTNYTATRVESYFQREASVFVGVPVFLRTGDLSHLARLGVGWRRVREDFSVTVGNTVPQDPADPSTGHADREDNESYRTGTVTIAPAYTIVLPGILDDHERNEFSAGIELNVDLNFARLHADGWFQNYTFTPGPGATRTVAARNEGDAEYTFTSAIDFGAAVHARHSFYVEPHDSMVLGFAPAVRLTFASSDAYPNLISEAVSVERVDGDNDGAFTSAADTITTRTERWVDMDIDGNDRETTSSLSFQASLPTSFRVRPADWRFGISLGSALSANVTRSVTTTYVGYKSLDSETTVQGDGSGTTSTTTATTATYDPDRTVDYSWEFTANHNLALHVYLPANARLDVEIRATNILQFGSLRIQAIVPLN